MGKSVNSQVGGVIMNCFDVEDVMDALSEVPDVELVELLFKYSQLEDLVMYYFVQTEMVDRFIKNVEV